MILEPLAEHPTEMRQFIDEHLNAPLEGTTEAKKATTDALFQQFPGLEASARRLVERKPKSETVDPYNDETPD